MIGEHQAAIIMAGGRSVRMRKSGGTAHKALRQVLGLPLIDWNLATLLNAGFRRIFVAVSAEEAELQHCLNNRGHALAESFAANLTTFVEEQPLGTIGAAALIPPDVSDLLVVNVDNVTDLDLCSFVGFHQQTSAALSVASHEHIFRIPFGRLVLEDSRVERYEEKPGISMQISSGTYVLSSRVIAAIPRGHRLDVPQLVNRLIDGEQKVVAYKHSAAWIDVNDESDLAEADALLSRRIPANLKGS